MPGFDKFARSFLLSSPLARSMATCAPNWRPTSTACRRTRSTWATSSIIGRLRVHARVDDLLDVATRGRDRAGHQEEAHLKVAADPWGLGSHRAGSTELDGPSVTLENPVSISGVICLRRCVVGSQRWCGGSSGTGNFRTKVARSKASRKPCVDSARSRRPEVQAGTSAVHTPSEFRRRSRNPRSAAFVVRPAARS